MHIVGDVNGIDAQNVFTFLKKATGTEIGWNFEGKYLIDRQGSVHAVSDTEPGTVEKKIKELLGKM